MNRLEFLIDIQGSGQKPRKVNVRGDLTSASLVSAIRDHFSLNGNFELRLPDAEDALESDAVLAEAGVSAGMTLLCMPVREASNTPAMIAEGRRRRFSQKFERVFLMEQNTFAEYDVTFWPAIIGRRDRSDPARNKLLAVDLEQLEQTPTVSRHHACLTEANGTFFIELLQDRNPVYVNGRRLEFGVKLPLPTGTTLQLGQIRLNFNLRS